MAKSIHRWMKPYLDFVKFGSATHEEVDSMFDIPNTVPNDKAFDISDAWAQLELLERLHERGLLLDPSDTRVQLTTDAEFKELEA